MVTLALIQGVVHTFVIFLSRVIGFLVDQLMPASMQAFGISGGRASGFKRLFMSHPPREERIAALRNS